MANCVRLRCWVYSRENKLCLIPFFHGSFSHSLHTLTHACTHIHHSHHPKAQEAARVKRQQEEEEAALAKKRADKESALERRRAEIRERIAAQVRRQDMNQRGKT